MEGETTQHLCTTCKKQFRIIKQEHDFYHKKSLPLPQRCPECRRSLRLSAKSDRKLYKRSCDSCKKEMISAYSADSKLIVYCQECFWRNIAQ